MLNRIKYGIMAIVFACVGVLGSTPNAYAVSDFDDIISDTENLDIRLYNANETLSVDEYDFSKNWFVTIKDALTYYCDDLSLHCSSKTDFENMAIEDPQRTWTIMRTSDTKQFYMIYDTDNVTPPTGTFQDYGGEDSLVFNGSMRDLRGLRLYKEEVANTYRIPNQDVWVRFYSIPATQSFNEFVITENMSWYGAKMDIWVSSFPITYPPDYEGIIIPDTWSMPVMRIPQFGWNVHSELILRVQYLQNLSVTGAYWNYYLYEADEDYEIVGDLLDYKQLDTRHMYEYMLPEIGKYRLEITPGIKIPQSLDDIKDIPKVTFKINADGYFTSGSNLGKSDCLTGEDGVICDEDKSAELENCMIDEFPFVDAPACLANIGRITSMLSFGTLKFGNDWTWNNGCKDLEVLDEWLGLQNGYVCPQVPLYIRNAVTPFITFMLGLITVRWLASRGGRGETGVGVY